MPSSGLPAACCAPPAPLAQTAAPAAAGEPAHGAAIVPHKGSGFVFGHPSGPTMQPHSAEGQGSLFDMGCIKAEGVGAAQKGAGGS
eukprot:1142435-Pelagomonas_calceolata.AAC.4